MVSLSPGRAARSALPVRSGRAAFNRLQLRSGAAARNVPASLVRPRIVFLPPDDSDPETAGHQMLVSARAPRSAADRSPPLAAARISRSTAAVQTRGETDTASAQANLYLLGDRLHSSRPLSRLRRFRS